MKMVYANFNISSLPEVQKILDDNGVHDYQIVDHVLGRNRKGHPRLDNAVWPGYNAILFIPFKSDANAAKILAEFKKFNQQVFTNDELITACSWNFEGYLFE